MRRITRQGMANDAARRWHEQYHKNGDVPGDKGEIYRALVALGPTPNPDNVDRVIGNGSWTSTRICGECRREGETPQLTTDDRFEVGEEPDYESSTAYLCLRHVRELAKLAGLLEHV